MTEKANSPLDLTQTTRAEWAKVIGELHTEEEVLAAISETASHLQKTGLPRSEAIRNVAENITYLQGGGYSCLDGVPVETAHKVESGELNVDGPQ